MKITAATGVKFKRDRSGCTLLTNKKQYNKCSFEDNDIIKISGAFSDNGRYSYEGTVVIEFTAVNPSSNEDRDDSLKLEIYSDNSYEYPVDRIEKGLNPAFRC